MQFASDNAGPAHPAILNAIARANDGHQRAYGSEGAMGELRGRIREIIVQRWPLGAPYGFPGRPGIAGLVGRLPEGVALAGDWMDFPNMDAAVRSGEAAATRLLAGLPGAAGRNIPEGAER